MLGCSKTIKAAFNFGLVALLTACTSTGTAMKADPGPYPANYQQDVQTFLSAYLKDPGSISQFSESTPHQGVYWMGALYGGAYPAWAVCIQYNAKNSYGGYVGLQHLAVYIKDDQVIRWEELPAENDFSQSGCEQ
jgi:hypothetical protein